MEEPRFHRFLTGRENLAITAAVRGPEAHARIDGVLARVGLSDRADERVKSYSLGMRQRLGVARALLADPELLILDEPTNGLDPAGIHEFRQMIRGFVDEGMTVLLSSHLLDEVEKVADYVAIVDSGRVVLQGLDRRPAGGGRAEILVSTSDESQAMAVLVLDATVCAAERTRMAFASRCGPAWTPRPRPERHAAARGGGRRRPPRRTGACLARAAISGNHDPIGGSEMSVESFVSAAAPARRRRERNSGLSAPSS